MKKVIFIIAIIVFAVSCTNMTPVMEAVKQGGQVTGETVVTTKLTNAKFQGIEYIEDRVIGMTLVGSGKSIEQRIDFLEDKIVGNRSNDNVLIRQRKIYDLVFLDGSYYSLNTKVDNLEDYMFQERYRELDLLTRIEKVEEYLLGFRKNKTSILDRINEIYQYLLISDKDFVKKGQFLKRQVDTIEIRPIKKYGSLELGEILEFNLEKEIEGIAKPGSIVIGKVISKTKGTLFDDEKVTILLGKIINEERREISIYKKLEINGNVQRVFGGKYVRIDDMLIIG